MIKFEHSVFALPFAYLGLLFLDKPPTILNIIWVTLAMIGARSFALSLNRIIDLPIDRKNPRTKEWALPKGILSIRETIVFAIISLAIFALSISQLSRWCWYLSPVPVIIFIVYPYTKRFTWLNHIVLGLTLGAAPVGTYLAVANTVSLSVILVGLAVAFWVAGFDITYSCLDFDFDKKEKLYSIPARFGIKNSLYITKFFHFLTVMLLAIAGLVVKFKYIYFLGLLFLAILLVYENSLVKEKDLSRVNTAFFTVNGFVSIGMFIFALLDKLIF